MFRFLKNKWIIKKNDKVNLSYVDRRKKPWINLMLLIPAFGIIITFIIIPFFISASNTFEYLPNIHDKTRTAVGFKNWTLLFENSQFSKSLQNSILYAFISVPIVLIISAIISATLASVGRKWLRGIFQTVFFLPYVTSAIAVSLAFIYIFDIDNGVMNSILGKRIPWLTGKSDSNYALTAMIIYGTWRGIAFNVLIMTTAMLGVEKTLYKSASIDGAGPIRQFFSITLPSIRRTINFLLTMSIIGSIKVFPLALFNNNPSDAMSHGGGTLLLFVYKAVRDGNIQMAAVSSIFLLIISISFSVVFKNMFTGTVNLANYIGDRNVSNKIKIKTLMR